MHPQPAVGRRRNISVLELFCSVIFILGDNNGWSTQLDKYFANYYKMTSWYPFVTETSECCACKTIRLDPYLSMLSEDSTVLLNCKYQRQLTCPSVVACSPTHPTQHGPPAHDSAQGTCRQRTVQHSTGAKGMGP
ncbi:hypothetical protein J1605_010797 [Eschrichtius robustus]|uniref:Uncharacterized protein n=1 Tax=Eschrichtius robustus TaxID=9764 RepID=A0AB34GRA1_ESCRO|nr:hypothetical protein J1605_010797 [Eschrichtius robustus]